MPSAGRARKKVRRSLSPIIESQEQASQEQASQSVACHLWHSTRVS